MRRMSEILETIILLIVVLVIVGAICTGGAYLIRNHKTNAEETARIERLQRFYIEMAEKYPVKGD